MIITLNENSSNSALFYWREFLLHSTDKKNRQSPPKIVFKTIKVYIRTLGRTKWKAKILLKKISADGWCGSVGLEKKR